MKKYRIYISIEEWIEDDAKFVRYESREFSTNSDDVPHIRDYLEVFFAPCDDEEVFSNV